MRDIGRDLARFTVHAQATTQVKAAVQRAAIQEFISSRGITHLVHFTPVENLQSIAEENCLLNRETLRTYSADGLVFPDKFRGDHAEWAICCSLQWPNYSMLWKKRHILGVRFAVFILKPSILWDYDCVFVEGNASRADLRLRIPSLRQDKLNKLSHLKALYPDPDQRPQRWRCYPSDIQAEVLVDAEYIDLEEYCSNIAFDSDRDLEAARNLPWSKQIKCIYLPSIFGRRPDITE
jgi:hypothetical protein